MPTLIRLSFGPREPVAKVLIPSLKKIWHVTQLTAAGPYTQNLSYEYIVILLLGPKDLFRISSVRQSCLGMRQPLYITLLLSFRSSFLTVSLLNVFFLNPLEASCAFFFRYVAFL